MKFCVFYRSQTKFVAIICGLFTTRRGVLRFDMFLRPEEEYWHSTGFYDANWDSTGFYNPTIGLFRCFLFAIQIIWIVLVCSFFKICSHSIRLFMFRNGVRIWNLQILFLKGIFFTCGNWLLFSVFLLLLLFLWYMFSNWAYLKLIELIEGLLMLFLRIRCLPLFKIFSVLSYHLISIVTVSFVASEATNEWSLRLMFRLQSVRNILGVADCGSPISLKRMTKALLQEDIQVGPHCSFEDAWATMRIFKVSLAPHLIKHEVRP